MGEKEGTAPSRTKSKEKPSLNAQKKAQATADARVRSLFVTSRPPFRLPRHCGGGGTVLVKPVTATPPPIR